MKTQKLEFELNSKESLTKLTSQIFMKFTYSYCDKTQKLQFWYKKSNFLQKSKVKNNLTPWQPMRYTQGSLLKFCNVFQRPTCFVFDY